MLRVENLKLCYGHQEILNSISFSIEKGKIIGLLGPNGAGKSSIIKVLAGLVKPETGILKINNTLAPFDDLRKQCGYLIDSPTFYPYLTAKQNLKLIQKLHNQKQDLSALLEQVGLTASSGKKVKHFSTGMKQRLAIALALLRNPKLLILDEPFNGLDPNGFKEVVQILTDLREAGTTILVSSHLLKDLEELADVFMVIHNGDIVLDISKKELLKSSKKVTFTFPESLSKNAQNFVVEKEGQIQEDNKVVLFLLPDEIAETVNAFVSLGQMPINIETHTILQQKYFELAC